MICKLTGLQFHDIKKIAECLVIVNAVSVDREPSFDKEPDRTCDGRAYVCKTKGVCIGYLPLLRTLRKYMAEAQEEEAKERIRQWGLATKAIRQQLKIDHDNIGREHWTAKVSGILYERADKWLEVHEYSELCPTNPAEAAKWTLKQVAVNFENVLEF